MKETYAPDITYPTNSATVSVQCTVTHSVLIRASRAAIMGCLVVPTLPRFNRIISNSHSTFVYLRTKSIQNYICDTNERLIVDFASPKGMTFSSKMHHKAFGGRASMRSQRFHRPLAGCRGGVPEREGRRRGKGRDTPLLQTDSATG